MNANFSPESYRKGPRRRRAQRRSDALTLPRFFPGAPRFLLPMDLPFCGGDAGKKNVKTLEASLLPTATQRLVAEFQPDQVWLFGSHAWGSPHWDSDVDFLVIVPQSNETPIRRSQRAHRCLRGLRMPKDVLVETRQEVDRVREFKTSLENLIFRRGRRLYG